MSSNAATGSTVQDVALIVGGGPGISASCAKLFAANGMRVAHRRQDPGQAGLASPREIAWRASIRV